MFRRRAGFSFLLVFVLWVLMGGVPAVSADSGAAHAQVAPAKSRAAPTSFKEGLVLHYSFDGDSDRKVTDLSGMGNHGKVRSGTYTANGVIGRAMYFNGDGDYIDIGDDSTIETEVFTLTAWIKTGDTGGRWQTFLSFEKDSHAISVLPNGRIAYGWQFVGGGGEGTSDVRTGRWAFVAVTRDANYKTHIYINDRLENSFTDETKSRFAYRAKIGGDVISSEYFSGCLDEIRLYNRALSAFEVKGLYKATLALATSSWTKPRTLATADVRIDPPAPVPIRGVVRDQLGKPGPGVLVLPLPHGGHPVMTDEGGKFELEGPSEDRIILRLFFRDLNRNLAAAVSFDHLEYSLNNKPLQVALSPAVTLTGLVTDLQGRPIAGARVAPAVETETYGAGFGYTRFQPSDSNGHYKIKALPTGQKYSVGAAAEGYEGTRILVAPVDQPGRGDLPDIVLHAKPEDAESLIGKPLPELTDLGVEFSPQQAEGKPMLICFWDIHQRPSRHMVRQLSKKADNLARKGVVLLGAHVSTAGKEELKDWLEKSQTSFPVGTPRGDPGKVRFDWGARSLPWLILTDTEHVVRAQGFGLDELDEKISKVTREVKIQTAKPSGSAAEVQHANEKMAHILTDPKAEIFKMTWHPGGAHKNENMAMEPGCLRVYDVEMSSVPPRGQPRLLSPGGKYGQLEFFDYAQTKYVCGLRKSSDELDQHTHDIFFVDLNHNGRLEERELFKGELRDSKMGPRWTDYHYGPIELTLFGRDGPRVHRVFACHHRFGSERFGQFYLTSHCYMSGRMRLGHEEVTAVLVDYSCDGRYDSGKRTVGSPGPFMSRDFDKIGWDKDGDGKIQRNELQYIGSYVLHGGKVYRVETLPDGELLAVLPVEVPMGRLQMPAKNAFVRLVGEVGPIDLVITDSVIEVPAGTYWVSYLSIEEPGEDGQVRRVNKSGRYFDEPWQIHPNSVLRIERAMCEVTEADKKKYEARMRGLEAASAGPQARSILGEPLGDLEEFGIKIAMETGHEKMILLCFWDMNQRPSRHMVRELAKRAEGLKEKGVTVVAVQASKVDRNELDAWIKKYQVSFPVGMVQGDEEGTRLNWGVKSLPWPILTDRQHIVRAEGFALNELGEKLKQINGE